MTDQPTDSFLEAVAKAREEIERIHEIRKLAGRLAAETCCSHNYTALKTHDPAESRYCIGCGKAM